MATRAVAAVLGLAAIPGAAAATPPVVATDIAPVQSIVALSGPDRSGWLVSARRSGVALLDRTGELVVEYRCTDEVRVIAAAEAGFVGVSGSGYSLSVWSWQRASEPIHTIRVCDRIHSLALEVRSS